MPQGRIAASARMRPSGMQFIDDDDVGMTASAVEYLSLMASAVPNMAPAFSPAKSQARQCHLGKPCADQCDHLRAEQMAVDTMSEDIEHDVFLFYRFRNARNASSVSALTWCSIPSASMRAVSGLMPSAHRNDSTT